MPNEYLSAYAPMQSNAQYGQPMVMGQGSQDAMHQAMLQQQQQYNNQAAQTAAQGNPMGSMARGGMNALMLAQALRGGMGQKPEMMGGQQTPNWQNPYANYDNGAGSGSSGIE